MFATRRTLLRFLTTAERRCFAVKNEEVHKNINKAIEKVRLKQSVADIKKLQGYIEQTKTDKSLNIAISRSARYDQEFNEFLKQYKDKNKEFANIVDLSHYSQDQNLAKSQEMREEELVMLEEFRRRKKDKTLYLDSDDEFDKGGKEKDRDEDEKKEAHKVIDPARFSPRLMTKDTIYQEDKLLNNRLSKLYGNEEFLLCVLDRGTTTLVTTLNRVNHFRYLVFMGNANGVIGYGKGKGGNFEIALNNAIKDCKKNLIAIPLDHFRSLTTPILAQYNGMRLYLTPRDQMNAWGSPVMATMLMLSGVTNCSFKLISRNANPYMLVYCLFKALTKAKTPKELAEGTGYKIYHHNYATWQYSDAKNEVNNI